MSEIDTYAPHGATTLPEPNGAAGGGLPPAPPAPPAGPVIGKRLEWLPKKGDVSDATNAFRAAYPGFHFQMWMNYPQRLEADLLNQDEDRDVRAERVKKALRQIIVAHNGWRLENPETGAPEDLPAPTTAEFWDLIPNELATAMLLMLHRAASDLPNSMLPRNRNSGRG